MTNRTEFSKSQQLFKLIQTVTSTRFISHAQSNDVNMNQFVRILKGGAPVEQNSSAQQGCRLVISKHELKDSQLLDNLEHLINLQHKHLINQQPRGSFKIERESKSDALQQLYQTYFQLQLKDQTVLQAVGYFNSYIATMQGTAPPDSILKVIAMVALVMASKMNEDTQLDLGDVAATLPMANSLQLVMKIERHMLASLNYRLNRSTSLDFLLHFAAVATEIQEAEASEAQETSQDPNRRHMPENVLEKCLPFLHLIILDEEITESIPPAQQALLVLEFCMEIKLDLSELLNNFSKLDMDKYTTQQAIFNEKVADQNSTLE